MWIYDFERRYFSRLTSEGGEDETAVWSPDGSRIALSAARTGKPRMIPALPAGGGPPVELTWAPNTIHVSDWLPDGRVLAWTEFSPTSRGAIRALAFAEPGAIRTVVSGPFDVRGAVFSPDGKWIAYTSNESGRDEVYVQPFPGPGSKWRLSMDGGQEPVWSRSGTNVYFRGQGRMMSVEVSTSPTFSPGTQHSLFTDTYLTEPPAELNVVLNWPTMLGRRE